jgi:integrase/recombinase XerD
VGLDNGLRLSEITDLKWNHVNLTSGKLRVKDGKGAKDRNLWMSGDNLDLMREWKERQIKEWQERKGKPDAPQEAPDYVFTTLKGTQISNRYVQKMVTQTAEKAGIEKNVHPHVLRHTFATDLYQDTGKIRLVQKALGHADLSTTMIYTHIVDDALEKALKNFRKTETSPDR